MGRNVIGRLGSRSDERHIGHVEQMCVRRFISATRVCCQLVFPLPTEAAQELICKVGIGNRKAFAFTFNNNPSYGSFVGRPEC